MGRPKVGLDRSKTGRRKGTPNKTTAVLKDAILLAAEMVGGDGAGRDGLVGYLTHVAKSDVRAFAGLLGRVLPLQVTGKLEHEHTKKEQKDAAVAAFLQAEAQNHSGLERLQ